MRKKLSEYNSNFRNINSLSKQIEEAVDVLKQGGIIAFPTETSYGLGVDPFNECAVEKLYRLKKRDFSKPILLLIASVHQLTICTDSVPRQYNQLIEKYWPGPLTLIFPASKNIPDILKGGKETIAIRQSPHAVATAIVEKISQPITATSANISNQKPAVTSKDCLTIFGDHIDYIVDNKEKGHDTFSTIVGLVNGQPTVFRDGVLKIPEIE